ncbi:P-loop containing nucleoside triphosphate hydrolase protein [Hysterangium stoloniferum]|nr:P-loop containing nucleoside triphosphate hydrolase protein [Hysterangium stoloniferum]
MADSEDENDGDFSRHSNVANGSFTRSDRQGSKKARIANGASPCKREKDLLQQRQDLPIWTGRDTLVKEVRANDTVVILGETGSGKTTQVPQFLYEAGFTENGIIACTQPRRVAATSLAARVAEEQDVPLGTRVGYAVRFDERSGPETKIKFLTDGLLVKELLGDPLLLKYSVIIVDEAHERTLRTDFLLASLKDIQKKRNAPKDRKTNIAVHKLTPLKIVIMSATLDAEKFSRYYDNAKILNIKGRQHTVKILYTTSPQLDYVEAAMKTFFQLHTTRPPGDVLIFLPGQEEIESIEQSIRNYSNELPLDKLQVIVCPMYASLAPHIQSRVFLPTPPNSRKCIIATNIAETSITIPGIKYVIDTGLCKEKSYVVKDRRSAIESLISQPVSKSSAMQRAGRAGRLGEGVCFRLYTEDAYHALRDSSIPEIQRSNLTSSILQLKCLGQSPEEVNFMDPPDPHNILSSFVNLVGLGALDNKNTITNVGRQMASLPLEVPLARSLLASKEHGCTAEVLAIISLTSASSRLFIDSSETRDEASAAHQKFYHPSGYHMSCLNVFRAYADISGQESVAVRRRWCKTNYLNERTLRDAALILEQLRENCQRLNIDWKVSCGDDPEPILRSLVRGLHQNVALLHDDGQYRHIEDKKLIKISPESNLIGRKPKCIIFEELVLTRQVYARGVSMVPITFILELPKYSTRSA